VRHAGPPGLTIIVGDQCFAVRNRRTRPFLP